MLHFSARYATNKISPHTIGDCASLGKFNNNITVVFEIKVKRRIIKGLHKTDTWFVKDRLRLRLSYRLLCWPRGLLVISHLRKSKK